MGGKDNIYQYNGKEIQDDVLFTTEDGIEIDLGYYDYGARFYDPAIGRFTGVDPLADEMSAWNPYTYVYNDPLSFTDPTGMAPFTDYLNTNGKVIGNDGNDNGKLVVVTDKKEAKSIKRTNKAGGVTAENDVSSGVALPSSFVRGRMGDAVESAGSPSFHEEGGYFGTTSGGEEFVVDAEPGEESNPLVDEMASINVFKAADISTLPKDANPTIEGTFHTHPDGVKK